MYHIVGIGGGGVLRYHIVGIGGGGGGGGFGGERECTRKETAV